MTKRKKIYLTAGLLLSLGLVVAGVWASRRQVKPVYETFQLTRRTLTQMVSVTGKVKAAQAVELGFERGGKVAKVAAEVGQSVKAGDELVSLQNAELAAQLRQAQASADSSAAQVGQYQAALDAVQAKLDELKRGTRQEDIQVKQAELLKSNQDLTNLFGDVPDTLADAQAKASDAVNNKTDALFDSDTGTTPQLTFGVATLQAEINAESARFAAGKRLGSIIQAVAALGFDEASRLNALAAVKSSLVSIRGSLDLITTAVNGASGLSATTLTTYQTDMASASAEINTAATSISTLEQSIAAQRASVEKVQQELNLLLAGTPPEQIAAQQALVRQAQANLSSGQAQLRQAQANVANVQAQLATTVVRAPFAGVVTRQDAKVGEIVSASSPLVALISAGQYEIEAFIPEVDISNVALGNSAGVTLDAYGSSAEFPASVTAVDPAETVVEGVSTYKATLQFSLPDERIKSGMTANVEITTAKRENALAVPARAVAAHNSSRSVSRLKADGTPEEVLVTIGVRSADGLVEILAGLQEGDLVVVGQTP